MHLRFSQDIAVLLEKLAHQPLRLRDIVEETEERGFVLIIGLLVLPFLFPMPPGVTTILGPGCLVISIQMALGRKKLWLPKFVGNFKFPSGFASQLLGNLQRVNRWLAKITRARWFKFANHPRIAQINGLCLAWLTFLLMLPIPFTNPIPTVVMLMLVVAILEADGLLMVVCYALTALMSAVLGGAIAYFWVVAPEILKQWFK